MVNPEFAQAIKSPNGHIYLKVLRERVLSELNFGDGVASEELEWEKSAMANAMNDTDGKSYNI